jgi:hypothetical protein
MGLSLFWRRSLQTALGLLFINNFIVQYVVYWDVRRAGAATRISQVAPEAVSAIQPSSDIESESRQFFVNNLSAITEGSQESSFLQTAGHTRCSIRGNLQELDFSSESVERITQSV